MVSTCTENLDPNHDDFLNDPTLVDPDAHAAPGADQSLPWDVDFQRQIVAHVVHVPDLCEFARTAIKPTAFLLIAHQKIVRIAFDYNERYGTAIPFPILSSLLKADIDGRKDKVFILGEMKTVCDYAPVTAPAFFKDKLREFARADRIKKAYQKLIDSGDYAAFDKLYEESKRFAVADAGATEAAWYTDDDVDAFTAPVWQVAEHVERGSLVCVFGSSGSGKTFFCLDLAFCVATGRKFLDRFEVQKGKVCYVCSEGGQSGYKIRRDAWKTHHGVKAIPRESYVFTLSAFDLSDGAEVEKLAEKAKQHFGAYPDLMVVDTLSMNFGGGDVDKNQDMKRFTLEMDRLRRITGATVLVVHHTGWSEKERETGAKTLRNTIDTSILVSREGTEVEVKFKKQRNAALGERYVLLSKPVGTSAVLVYEAAPAPKPTDDDANESKVADAIPVGTKADDGVTVEQIGDATGLERSVIQKAAAALFKRNAVQRAREGGVTMPFRYWREGLLA